jgi:alpha-beta hydrolase superfamily lysophospholipase
MRHEESSTETPEGLRLYQQSWRGATTKAAIVLVHGYAEHSGRYEHVAERFTDAGYAVHTFDLRGHGRSDGQPRAYVESIEEHTGDVERFVDSVRERENGLPMFLLGHSMGGAISARYLTDGNHGFTGAILSAPAVRRAGILGRPLEGLFLFIAGLVPHWHIPALASDKVSRDPETVRLYDSDPLLYREGLPLGTAAAIVRSARHVDKNASSIELPIFIGHGTDDALVNHLAGERLHGRVGSDDKTLKLYEGFYHEILNEPEREQVMQDMVEWLDARV